MADRLEELKKVARLNGDTYSSAEVMGLVSWAADEIERRKEKYPYSELDMDMHVEAVTKDLKAEIERLRAALESLTKDPPATFAREPDEDAEVIIKMRAIAREALNIHKRGEK